MPLSTLSAAVHLTPTVISTFVRHYVTKARKQRRFRNIEATDEILFDEAFHIVRSFIDLGTHNTVESLQSFTNTHVPSPPWTVVVPVLVPLSSCDDAARYLIQAFGPAEIIKVVGGERWWQVRGLDGVKAEWIAMRVDWKKVRKAEKESAGKSGTAPPPTVEGGGEERHAGDQESWQDDDDDAGEINEPARRRSSHYRRPSSQRRRRAAHGRNASNSGGDESPATDEYSPEMDDLKRVMLYIHGGAYYWGSINTHRYQMIRYARKMAGRVFAVNYRKAPQYPFPCALQDCLAAYLYLIRPPPEAAHAPVSPDHLVIAGDSAGGGLAISLLTILRDVGLPLPAGAVLISPWVDLTHSFPSVMKNTATDIIPPYGFIHKPSCIWPHPARGDRIWPREALGVPTDQKAAKAHRMEVGERKEAKGMKKANGDGYGGTKQVPDGVPPERDVGSEENAPGAPEAGEATHDPTTQMPDGAPTARAPAARKDVQEVVGPDGRGREGGKQVAEQGVATQPPDARRGSLGPIPSTATTVPAGQTHSTNHSAAGYASSTPDPATNRSSPHFIKVPLTSTPDAEPVELRTQIQLYAKNEQLTHPYVSPLLQGSLGGLPPMYILAGDAEVLRDEVMYLAHKAAHPDRFPLRDDLLQMSERQRENVEKYNRHPTKVHLQVFDDMCHVLTVFSWTKPAKYAYRAIASFCRHVTGAPSHELSNPFPDTVLKGADGAVLRRTESPAAADYPDADPANSTGNSLPRIVTGDVTHGITLGKQGVNWTESPVSTSFLDPSGPQSPFRGPDGGGGGGGGAGTASPTVVQSPTDFAGTPTSATSAFSDKDWRGDGKDDNDPKKAARREKLHLREEKRKKTLLGHQNEYSGVLPLKRPSFQNFMVRERVAVNGNIRPLEPATDIPALRLPPSDIGIIKETPVRRWLTGQELWDKKFSRTARTAERERERWKEKGDALVRDAREKGIITEKEKLGEGKGLVKEVWKEGGEGHGQGTEEGRSRDEGAAKFERTKWTIFDLDGETPPPSSITASRRDTPDSYGLLKRTLIELRSPSASESKTGKKRREKASGGSPGLSAAEQEVSPVPQMGIPHGVHMWNGFVRFMERKAMDGKTKTKKGLGKEKGMGDADGKRGDKAGSRSKSNEGAAVNVNETKQAADGQEKKK